jgi:hypothetical protein
MKRAIKLSLLLALVFVAGIASAALTVILTGPATYADKQWTSIHISNRPIDPATGNFVVGSLYVGVIEVCPTSNVAGVVGSCTTSTRSVATLNSTYQTFVNGWITFWLADHAGF